VVAFDITQFFLSLNHSMLTLILSIRCSSHLKMKVCRVGSDIHSVIRREYRQTSGRVRVRTEIGQ